ncbi:MAG: iron ABC transporter permease [Bdellovibrionota bacterium]|nr:MAG: iron ABC transporter permease [Bdellovibrionota bacterium]
MKRLTILLLASILSVTTAPFVGITRIPLAELVAPAQLSVGHDIFWGMRVPRVIAAFLTGAALAGGGLAFQVIFRNVLATPFTLGVSSGAAFFVALYFLIGAPFALLGLSGSMVASFLGALCVLLMIRAFSGMRGGSATDTILLAGVVMSYVFSSLIILVQYLSDFNALFKIARWLMGGFEGVLLAESAPLLLIALACLASIVALAPRLNLLAFGDDFAASHGVPVRSTILLVLTVTCLMIGAVVAIAGPIGFVGIIIPQLFRLLWGADARWVMAGSVLGGGIFLVWCDAFARIVLAPYEIPVGVITSLIGGPYFLVLLWNSLRRHVR